MPAAPAASAIACIARSFRAATTGSSRGRLAREQRERFGLQPVAGEDRDAVAVDDVQRRPAATQRVVVHRRQVVVDQRVGVNQLDGARRRQRESAIGVVGRARLPRDGVGRGQREQRAQPLAAREDAVAHRLAEERRAGRRRGEVALERLDRRCARARSRNARAAGRGTSPRSGSSAGERGRRRLQLAALGEDLDAPLGLLEPRVTEARQLHAALVQRQRLLERQVAFFELLDDRLELGDRAPRSP